MKKLVVYLLITIMLAACAPTAAQVQKAIEQTEAAKAPVASADEPTAAPTKTKAPTKTQAPTKTKAPSFTPRPAITRRPTSTKKPTQTPTPIPEPIELTGSGSTILDFDNPFGAAFLHFVHEGQGNVVVRNIGPNNERIDLLVNAIGNYDGFRMLDWETGQKTKRFEIKAQGNWTVTVYPAVVEYLHVLTIPGEYVGENDDVVILDGTSPDILEYSFTGESNAIVFGYSTLSRDLLVNEIAPVSGSALIEKGTILLEIRAEGPWTIMVSGR